MIGVSLLVIGGIIIYVSLSQPRVYADKVTGSTVTQFAIEETTAQHENDNNFVTQTATSDKPEVVPSTTLPQITYPLNINTCTVEELMTIDGIGETRAYNIVEYRNQLGGYTSVEQIMDIQGIGEGVYANIAGYLTV